MRAVLIPVKSFRLAKLRLSEVLNDAERIDLARELATTVVHSAHRVPVYVACDDGDVANWATTVGAFVLWTPGLGLSGAVTEGVRHLAQRGASLVVVAHADLPFVEALDDFGTEGKVTIAPDRRLDGTNVAAIPASSGFQFAYGPRSYLRHCEEATRLNFHCETVNDWKLAFDVDTPADLEMMRSTLKSIPDTTGV